ncbi:hypothetical protein LMG28614_06561 [Paraburkholderia ultramafica]|uniref:Uncharacterized protein n=1 Tax=Paraburkholderia ultramafica TaxID=1544867 RepID=A0A6S7BNS8_9BURK|nr:hypothetical protein [Paraburkholderia ultramafica]CAB3807250.1 hypothetical protein LMG28614_06561 [Paraburkholderia ultramafica]
MDRRTFMMTGAWLSSAAGGAWPWLARAAARSNTLAIVDSTLACGPSFARYAAQMKLPVFETGDDIGALWYTTLAPLLGPTPGQTRVPTPPSLIGLTRASDFFVLSELATRAGQLVEHSHEQRAGSGTRDAHVTFAFTPRVPRQS